MIALFKDLASIDLDITTDHLKENRKHFLYFLNKYIFDEIFLNNYLNEHQKIKEELSSQSSSRILEDSMEYESSGSDEDKMSKISSHSQRRNIKEILASSFERGGIGNSSFNGLHNKVNK
jgi:hypothetical protein